MDLEKEKQLENDYKRAQQVLKAMGKLKTTSVSKEDGEFYRVELIKDDVAYTEEGYDAVIATIRLRNLFN